MCDIQIDCAESLRSGLRSNLIECAGSRRDRKISGPIINSIRLICVLLSRNYGLAKVLQISPDALLKFLQLGVL